MKKKEILYIVLVIFLIVCIISVIILKNVNNNANNNIDKKILGVWSKENTEYHRDINTKFTEEKIINTHINIKDLVIEFCDSEKINNICTQFKYIIEENELKVYIKNDEIFTYSYEVVDDNELIIVEQGEGYIRKNFYVRAEG